MKKSKDSALKSKFTRLLLQWNREENTRKMPWKGEKDPYRIWLSEIILQQTRVDQGLNYYNRFIQTFPDIHSLARARDEKVFKLWEGLGYYTRCRNLLATARFISKELNGKFPDNYHAIKSLKGVGSYTASAISSFAFNLPHAVVDGNVFRVLARVFGINKPVDTTEGKKYFTALAEELLDKDQPGIYNQAIMDFGAVMCKPANPLCTTCNLRKNCYAFQHNKISQLPIKKKKIRITTRWFYYLVMRDRTTVALRQRVEKDIWHSLYEFPLIETKKETPLKAILQIAHENKWVGKNDFEVTSVSAEIKQQLTHQLIRARFIEIRASKKTSKELKWVGLNKISSYAFPGLINQFLYKKSGS